MNATHDTQTTTQTPAEIRWFALLPDLRAKVRRTMDDSVPLCERDWRRILVHEAVGRAIQPALARLAERLLGDDPAGAAPAIFQDVSDTMIELGYLAVALCEGLRQVPATPETEREAQAKLDELVARAPKRYVQAEFRRMITDPVAFDAMRERASELEGELLKRLPPPPCLAS